MIYHCDHADEEALDLLEEAKDWVLTGPAVGVIISSIKALEDANDPANAPAIDELKQLFEDNCWTHNEMRRRGIPVVVGGDYGFAVTPQGTNARDLEHFVRHYGFSEAGTLQCATLTGARAMDMADELGQIREGFLADMLLVDGNPLDDITIMQDKERFLMIMKDGEIHQPAVMKRAEPGAPAGNWLAAAPGDA